MSPLNQLPPFWEFLVALIGAVVLIALTIWGFRRSDHAEATDEAKEELAQALARAKEEGAKEERDSNREKKIDDMAKTLEEIQRVQRSIFNKSSAIESKGAETALLLKEHIRNHERKIA